MFFESKNLYTPNYGAIGDGIHDDTDAISRALNSDSKTITFKQPPKFYKITKTIVIKNKKNKIISIENCKILNSSITQSFIFESCNNIIISGGILGHSIKIDKNGGNSQHVVQFNNCNKILVNKMHVINSSEMGIAITNCNNVVIKNSIIENTFRDGIYAHYSSNIKYLYNKLNSIKDDAISFHDYGRKSEKTNLTDIGLTQAENFVAQGNVIKNSYQGISSIGSKNILIKDNTITNTVLAGIAIFNSMELYIDGDAFVNHVKVQHNNISKACGTVYINKVAYKNNGQASTGRAAICICSLGKNNQINSGESKKLSNIEILENKVTSSGAGGLLCKDIISLKLVNNTFTNCSGENKQTSLGGSVVELITIQQLFAYNNTIVDTRNKVQHKHGYVINNSSGKIGKWQVNRYLSTKSIINESKDIQLIK